jgi:hypothetical protein
LGCICPDGRINGIEANVRLQRLAAEKLRLTRSRTSDVE